VSHLRPLLLLVTLASSVSAQQAADTARLIPVVVTATRVPVQRTVASQAITVLSGADLRERGIARVTDALRDVPGLAVVQSGPLGALTAVFARGGESDYMKVLIDGVSVNAAGGAFDFAHLTTDNIDRIEVVRGPASVLYGSDAVAGVIQIFTRTGDGPRAIAATLRGGSNASVEGDVLVSGRNTIGYSFGAGRRVTDGIYDFNNRYENTTVSAALNHRFARGDVALTGRHIDAEYHYPTDGSGQPVDSNAVRSERRTVVGLTASHRLGARLTGHVQFSANEVRAISDDQRDFAADASYSRDDARSHRRVGDARLDLALPAGSTLSAGYEYHQQAEKRTGTSSFGDPLPFDETRFNRAYYGQLIAGSASRASMVLGGRIDDNQRFGVFRTGRAAGSLGLGTGSRLRAAVGTAFKEPNFDEVYTTTFTIGNEALLPERSVSVEVGADIGIAGEAATVGVTVFRQNFRDMIQYVLGGPPDFRGHNENLAAARATGVEVEAHLRPVGPLSVSGAYTYLETSVRDAGNGGFGNFEAGKPLLRRPRNSGTARVAYRFGRSATASFALQQVGRRDDYDFSAGRRVVLPGYGRLDLGAEIPVIGQSTRAPSAVITLRVDNLLDKQYEPVLNFAAPGRVLLIGARLGVVFP
jgi:vitamin B12 transporter